MGERSKYTPGTFSWADLSTSDQDGAKTFYSGLFGWDAQDNPIPDDGVYSMMLVDDKPVGAISGQPEQQREAGVPPMWNSYVTVESADATAAKAAELGATVHAPPFDVMDVGRMAVIQDPQGAFFEIWEPKAHIGAHLVNGPGLLSWNELSTSDVDAAVEFYTGVFGWGTQAIDMPDGGKYVVINVDGHSNGGITALQAPGMPPNWLVYFGSDDIDASAGKIGELGGTVVMAPTEIMAGNKMAVATDPQGAVFALYAGSFED